MRRARLDSGSSSLPCSALSCPRSAKQPGHAAGHTVTSVLLAV